MQQQSGARLPVISENNYHDQPAIFIGGTRHSNGPEKITGEGFYIGSKDRNIYIRGGSGKGVVYGVYYVLQTYMGCRKDGPGPAFVPVSKNIQLSDNLSVLQQPQFIYRETYYPASADAEYLEWHALHRFEDLWDYGDIPISR